MHESQRENREKAYEKHVIKARTHNRLICKVFETSYGFLQKPLVPASLDEVTMEHIGSKLGKSEDQVEGGLVDKFA